MKYDALIFDMDGTLWDSTDTYVLAWNEGFKKLNLPYRVDRPILESVMGYDKANTFKKILPELKEKDYDLVYDTINEVQEIIMPKEGGKLYQNVYQGLELLSKKYKLFILSNCQAKGIIQMIDYCDIGQFITDELPHGRNYMPKHHNIKLLMEMHNIKFPAYIGDTDGDSVQCQLANVPFYFVSYGFGKTDNFKQKFDNFKELTQYFISLK